MTGPASPDGVARALLDAAGVGFGVSEVSIRVRSAMHRGGSLADRGSVLAVVAGLGAGVGLAVWAATLGDAAIPGRWVPFGLGLALMWLGIGLRQWAVLTLGRFFTVVVRVAPGQTVVDRGPYRWVRHPSYTGLLVTTLGLGLALGSWLSVAALVALPTAGVVLRIRVEERALTVGLGEAYRDYAAVRRRLVPGVW